MEPTVRLGDEAWDLQSSKNNGVTEVSAYDKTQ